MEDLNLSENNNTTSDQSNLSSAKSNDEVFLEMDDVQSENTENNWFFNKFTSMFHWKKNSDEIILLDNDNNVSNLNINNNKTIWSENIISNSVGNSENFDLSNSNVNVFQDLELWYLNFWELW